ncbi:MAG: hypothetical protein ABI898_00930 [Sphingomonadales bacterium]
MNQTAARRARILRLRTMEHRVAAVRLAQADAAHSAVELVALRVAALRDQVNVAEGLQSGSDLQSMGELVERLDRARMGLDHSLAQAADVRDARDAERIAARLKEDRTGRVHAEATRREATERELRAASARSPRFKKGVFA